MRLVVDASVALAWCFEDEADVYAQGILKSLASNQAVVPSHWTLEIANALLMAERKNRTQASDTVRALALLSALPIEFDQQTSRRAYADSLSLARAYDLTTYDAAYLELALRDGLPLATLDADLTKAANAAGVTQAKP